MRPAQIRVFDGLRISTDHVNHLQGAFASGFEDFREILGLGKPQTGLDVSVQDDGSVTIQPGVAFDYQKNRLACDDPLNVKLNLQPQDRLKFICLKYEEIEDGPVEGHATMIWDSCSALVRDVLPDPRENLVVLARVVKDAEGKLQVRRPVEHPHACPAVPPGAPLVPPVDATQVAAPSAPAPGAPPAPPVDATPAAAPSAPAPDAPPAPPVDATPAAAPSAPAPDAPPAPPVDATPVAAPSAPAPDAPVATPPVTPAPSTGGQLLLRQGVVQLASDAAAGSYLRSVVAPALRQKMGADSIQLSFTLAQADMIPDIRVAGFTTHCILTGDLVFPASADAPAPYFRLECVSHGEATVGAGALPQFAACLTQMHSVAAAGGALWSGSEFTGQGLAQFTWQQWSGAVDAARPPLPPDVLAGLQLLVQLAPAQQGFQMSVKLLWSGTIAEQSLQGLETQDIAFTWQVFFGWKAVGF